jgi:hypothetical protein
VPAVVHIGGQRLANVLTNGDQGHPQVMRDGADGYVVLFARPGGIASVHLSRTGAQVGGEAGITASAAPGAPGAAKLADGRIVVVWTAQSDGSGTGIAGRLLSAEGEPLAPAFAVNSFTSGFQRDPDVAALPDGGFVVVWQSDLAPPPAEGSDIAVVQRRFSASGAPQGNDAQVDDGSGTDHFEPAVAALAGGSWVVAWTYPGTDGRDVAFRRYGASGAPLGTLQPLATFTAGVQEQPDVLGRADGGFMAVWASTPPPEAFPEGEPIGDGIQSRVFDPRGVPHSQEVTVDLAPATANRPRAPALTLSERGLALVTADDGAIPVGRGLDPRDGRSIGTARSFHELATSDAAGVAAGFGGADALLVAWESTDPTLNDLSGTSLQVRAFSGGMVGSWGFDEGAGSEAHDVAGNTDNVATLAGDATWAPGRLGGTALGLGGAGWAEPLDSSELRLVIPGPDGGYGVTVAAWVWLDQLPSQMVEPFQGIFDGAQDNFVLYLDRDNTELRFKATLADGSTQRPGIPESQLATGRWLFVAGTYRPTQPSGTFAIFLDGTLVDAHAGNSGSVRTATPQVSAFGRDGVNSQYFFRGAVVRAWLFARGLESDEIELLRGDWLFDDGFENGSPLLWSGQSPP